MVWYMTSTGIAHNLLHFNLGQDQIITSVMNEPSGTTLRALVRRLVSMGQNSPAVKTSVLRLHLSDLENRCARQRTFPGKDLKAESEGIDDDPGQLADLNPYGDNLFGLVCQGKLTKLFEKSLGQGKLMHW